jgi:hypothetical protein
MVCSSSCADCVLTVVVLCSGDLVVEHARCVIPASRSILSMKNFKKIVVAEAEAHLKRKGILSYVVDVLYQSNAHVTPKLPPAALSTDLTWHHYLTTKAFKKDDSDRLKWLVVGWLLLTARTSCAAVLTVGLCCSQNQSSSGSCFSEESESTVPNAYSEDHCALSCSRTCGAQGTRLR